MMWWVVDAIGWLVTGLLAAALVALAVLVVRRKERRWLSGRG